MTRQYQIPQAVVKAAWKLVKANKGAAGIDGETIENFEKDLENNLYKIWNRMTSGSYFRQRCALCKYPKTRVDGAYWGYPLYLIG